MHHIHMKNVRWVGAGGIHHDPSLSATAKGGGSTLNDGDVVKILWLATAAMLWQAREDDEVT